MAFLLGASPFAEILGEPDVAVLEDTFGILEARIFYSTDRSTLYIFLEVDTSADYPDLKRYSYQYVGASGETIFRYDNSPHHPELPFFPSHKHEGSLETPMTAGTPSLRTIQSEIKDALQRGQRYGFAR